MVVTLPLICELEKKDDSLLIGQVTRTVFDLIQTTTKLQATFLPTIHRTYQKPTSSTFKFFEDLRTLQLLRCISISPDKSSFCHSWAKNLKQSIVKTFAITVSSLTRDKMQVHHEKQPCSKQYKSTFSNKKPITKKDL